MSRRSPFLSSAGALINELSILLSVLALFLLASLSRLEASVSDVFGAASAGLDGSFQIAWFQPQGGGGGNPNSTSGTEYQNSSEEEPEFSEGGGSNTSMGTDSSESHGFELPDEFSNPESMGDGEEGVPAIEPETSSETEQDPDQRPDQGPVYY